MTCIASLKLKCMETRYREEQVEWLRVPTGTKIKKLFTLTFLLFAMHTYILPNLRNTTCFISVHTCNWTERKLRAHIKFQF